MSTDSPPLYFTPRTALQILFLLLKLLGVTTLHTRTLYIIWTLKQISFIKNMEDNTFYESKRVTIFKTAYIVIYIVKYEI